MIYVNPLVLVILGEAAVLLGIALAACAAVFLVRRRRDKRAIQALVAAVQAQAEDRRHRTRAYLEGIGLQGARLGDALAALETEEKQFLRGFIRTYRRRDAAGVTGLLESLDALVSPYRSLPGPGASPGSPPDPGPECAPADAPPRPGSDAARVAELERENAELAAEIEATRDDLDRILGQYADLLAPGEPESVGAPFPSDADDDDIVIDELRVGG